MEHLERHVLGAGRARRDGRSHRRARSRSVHGGGRAAGERSALDADHRCEISPLRYAGIVLSIIAMTHDESVSRSHRHRRERSRRRARVLSRRARPRGRGARRGGVAARARAFRPGRASRSSSCSRRPRPIRRSRSIVEKRGPGLHHITLRVDDIHAALAQLKARGVAADRRAAAARRRGRAGRVHPSRRRARRARRAEAGRASPRVATRSRRRQSRATPSAISN